MQDYPKTDDTLTERVRSIMRLHQGYLHRIDRDELTRRVFGTVTDTYDRKIRDALAELPVIWQDGYFIPLSEREAEQYRATMESRIASIRQRLAVLDEHFRTLHEPAQSGYRQEALLEVR